MRTVCTEIIFNTLLISYIDKYFSENATFRTFSYRNCEPALNHVLKKSHGLEADRLTSGIGTGDNKYPVFFIKMNFKRQINL